MSNLIVRNTGFLTASGKIPPHVVMVVENTGINRVLPASTKASVRFFQHFLNS